MKAGIVIEFTVEEKKALEEAIDYFEFKRCNTTSFTKESLRLDGYIKALKGILGENEQASRVGK